MPARACPTLGDGLPVVGTGGTVTTAPCWSRAAGPQRRRHRGSGRREVATRVSGEPARGGGRSSARWRGGRAGPTSTTPGCRATGRHHRGRPAASWSGCCAGSARRASTSAGRSPRRLARPTCRLNGPSAPRERPVLSGLRDQAGTDDRCCGGRWCATSGLRGPEPRCGCATRWLAAALGKPHRSAGASRPDARDVKPSPCAATPASVSGSSAPATGSATPSTRSWPGRSTSTPSQRGPFQNATPPPGRRGQGRTEPRPGGRRGADPLRVRGAPPAPPETAITPRNARSRRVMEKLQDRDRGRRLRTPRSTGCGRTTSATPSRPRSGRPAVDQLAPLWLP